MRRNQDDTESFYLAMGPMAAILLGAALVPLRGFTTASNFGFVFMALTIVVAELGGRWAAVATALCSALSLDFFLTQPYMRLTIYEKHDVIAVVGLTICGLIAAAFGSQRGKQAEALVAARKHLDLLHAALGGQDSGETAESRLTRILRASSTCAEPACPCRRWRPSVLTVMMVAALAWPALPAAAQEPAPTPTPSPEPPKIAVKGFVDTYFAYNGNRPADRANFFRGVGTSAKRHDEVSINLAQLDFTVDPAPVGLHLAVGFGTATEVVHAAEPAGPFVGTDVWKHLVQASVIYKATGKLLFEGGVYPSHIGLEALAPKDNWNYTRSWLGELSPYYQTGLKTAYAFSESWSAQLHLLNGWQVIGDNNSGKAVGTQIAYSKGKLSASFNTFLGPELANDDDDYRALGDVALTFRPSPSWSVGASVDLAREGHGGAEAAHWAGGGLYARWAPADSRSAVAVRGEYYDDEDGAISGVAQTLEEVTVTLEHRPAPPLILRLEGRYDRSSADVFAEDRPGLDGQPLRKRSQFLLLLGAVASF